MLFLSMLKDFESSQIKIDYKRKIINASDVRKELNSPDVSATSKRTSSDLNIDCGTKAKRQALSMVGQPPGQNGVRRRADEPTLSKFSS
uniref:Uncharacterized protein n=1 Tax=Romanomermis culicivorax TaxID=13658 RepID=A0A915LA15_ROMCU